MEITREGKSLIGWMPYGRNVVVKVEEESPEAKRMKANGLIDPSTLSDSERQNLGFTTKAAEIANKGAEEQPVFEIIAVGPDCLQCSIGDKVMFMPGCQATSITVKGEFYLQLGEYEVLGKFL